MSFFQNKPAGTPSAFGTPQSTNTFSSFSTPPTAPKPGPFNLSGFGQSTTNTFGQQQNTNTSGGFGGFGGNVNQTAGSGFGQSNQQGGVFGQSTATQGGFGQNTGTGGFGQSSGSGFGAFGQNQGTGVFGQKPGVFGGGGLFSQQNQQQQQQANQSSFGGGGFLGQQPTFGQPSSFGGSTLGGSSLGSSWLQPQQQPQQQQAQQQPQISPITRWSDLPASDQKLLEDMEKYITQQKEICEDLKTRSPQLEEYVSSIPSDVAEVQKRFDTISHILTVDITILTNDLRQKFDLLSTQTQQAIRLLEVISHPSASSLSYLASTHGAGGDSLIDFFLQKTVEWQSRVDSFKREIAEIDRMLKAVEEAQMGGVSNSASEEILETIRAQWDGFCGLAARVGKLRERAAEVKIAVERGLRGGRL